MRIANREVSRITVVGFGRTGHAATEFFLSRGVRTFVSDSSVLSDSDRAFLARRGIPYEEGGHTEAGFTDAELVVLSPGVSPTLALLAKAKQQGIPIVSELDLAYQVSPAVPIIAVTGTNGKSTTVKLIEALLLQNGIKTIAAGNIGIPFISVVDRATAYNAIVLEVSSFQLEQSRVFHPQVAVLLNITPDHLDRHKTMVAYTAAKGRLFRHQTYEDTAILPSDLRGKFPKIQARRVLFDQLDLSSLPFIVDLPPHHRANLQAAIAACSALVPNFDPSHTRLEDLQEALFLPFRLRREGEINGVRVVNDSKSTNAASTLAALRSFNEPLVLILGGRHKQAGYAQLGQAIDACAVRKTILYGEAAAFLRETLKAAGCTRVAVFFDLQSAFEAALAVAQSGDVLLFSPACSSYDQYQDYIRRGEAFSRLVRAHPSFSPPQQGH